MTLDITDKHPEIETLNLNLRGLSLSQYFSPPTHRPLRRPGWGKEADNFVKQIYQSLPARAVWIVAGFYRKFGHNGIPMRSRKRKAGKGWQRRIRTGQR
jgi:hypothetical protein